MDKTSISVRISNRYFLRVYPKSKNYNVGVFWYLWREAIAILSKFSFVGLSQSATQQKLI
ncbi:MAG: hypothetical protein F6K39_10605 [Okeania sp. SIO3B3]|nr:hypothetical protein [Okeania sp. SIO3B3]